MEVLRGERTLGQIASEHKVAPTQLSQWRAIVVNGLPSLFENEQREASKQQAAHEAEQERLYAEIGRLTSELNWLKKRQLQS